MEEKYQEEIKILDDIIMEEKINKKIKKEWNKYKRFLQKKYPAKNGEEWQFTCEYHKKIDKLINSTYITD